MVVRLRDAAVTSAVAALSLVVVAVACALVLYMWLISSSWAASPSPSSVSESMKVEASALVKSSDSVLAIDLYVRNTGSSDLLIDAMYVSGGGLSAPVKCHLLEQRLISPGEVARITGYPSAELQPGVYLVKVVSRGGVEAAAKVRLTAPALASKVFVAAQSNTVGNELTSEDDAARYEVWVSQEGSYYKVHFRVWAKPGVTIRYVRAELLDRDLEHPDWVGNNPWEWTTPYTWPDWAGVWWYPVKDEEFPVTVVISIARG